MWVRVPPLSPLTTGETMDAAVIILAIISILSLILNAALWIQLGGHDSRMRTIRRVQQRQDRQISNLDDTVDELIDDVNNIVDYLEEN